MNIEELAKLQEENGSLRERLRTLEVENTFLKTKLFRLTPMLRDCMSVAKIDLPFGHDHG